MQHHHLCVRLDVDVCIDRGSWISLNYVARTTNISIVSNWKTINFYFFFFVLFQEKQVSTIAHAWEHFKYFVQKAVSPCRLLLLSTSIQTIHRVQRQIEHWGVYDEMWYCNCYRFFFIILADYLNEAESCCSTSVRVYWAVPNSISITILGVVQLHKCPLLVLIDVEHRSCWCAHTTI